MVLYTNQPYGLIFPNSSAKFQDINGADGIIEALKGNDGKMHVCRLISTNPRAYLNPDYSPGSLLKKQ